MHDRAGQPLDEVRRRGVDRPRLRKDLRPVPLQPQNFRADRLRGERVAAAVEQHLLADLLRSARRSPWPRAHRRRRARRSSAARRPRRPAACRGRCALHPIALMEAGATLLSASSFWVMNVRSSHQSSRGRCSAQPGCGTIISCGLAALATISPLVVDQHALRFERADVDAEIVLHWMKSSRSRLNFASIRCKRGDEQPRQLLRGRRGRRPRATNACSAPEIRHRSTATPSPTSCT